jgi:hypothetical protein
MYAHNVGHRWTIWNVLMKAKIAVYISSFYCEGIRTDNYIEYERKITSRVLCKWKWASKNARTRRYSEATFHDDKINLSCLRSGKIKTVKSHVSKTLFSNFFLTRFCIEIFGIMMLVFWFINFIPWNQWQEVIELFTKIFKTVVNLNFFFASSNSIFNQTDHFDIMTPLYLAKFRKKIKDFYSLLL